MGGVECEFGVTEVLPGNEYVVATFAGVAGTMVTFEVSSKGNVEVDFMQDSGGKGAPIGVFVVPCL